MKKSRIDEIHALAMRFYREAESPSEEAISKLFHALIHANRHAVVELLKANGVEVEF